jgi:hypothetical protein
MGIIAVLLFSQGHLGSNFYVPFWVVLICQATIALGTLVGGWRIVRTVGSKITRITPVQGCCASAAGAIMLFAATFLASRCPRHTRLPVRSSASAQPAKLRRSTGTSPAISWQPGS